MSGLSGLAKRWIPGFVLSPFKEIRLSIRIRTRPTSVGPRRVLLTGAAGTIGKPVCAELVRRGHWVRGMDLVAAPTGAPAHEWVVSSINDPAGLDAAMKDVDVVVHFAAVLEDKPFEPDLIEANVRGCYRVFEAARAHKVKRMIFAGSVNSMFWHTYLNKRPIKTNLSFEPLDLYSTTKIFGEQLGNLYGRRLGLPTIVLRFGWLPPNAENRQKLIDLPDYHDWYLSPGDAARGTALAVEAPDWRVGKFAVAFIAGKPKGAGPFDLRPAKRLLGYEPQDQFDPKG